MQSQLMSGVVSLSQGLYGLSASSTAHTAGITPKCEWANKIQSSGALDAIQNIIGNIIGVLGAFWWVVIAVFAIAAVVTLVVGVNHNRGFVKGLLLSIGVGILLVSIITLAVSIGGTGTCS